MTLPRFGATALDGVSSLSSRLAFSPFDLEVLFGPLCADGSSSVAKVVRLCLVLLARAGTSSSFSARLGLGAVDRSRFLELTDSDVF